MGISKWIGGSVEVELVSAELSRLVNGLTGAGIELQEYREENFLTARCRIGRKAYPIAASVCDDLGGTIRILKRNGVYWTGKQLLKRPVLLTGMVLLIFLYLWIPGRIFFVKVEGNHMVSERKILAMAESCGLPFGVPRKLVRSEKLKNELLARIPELKWAGVNTAGCVATVTVREKPVQLPEEEPTGVSSIVADRDAYILSASATRGTLTVQPGQTVQKGQLLISGYTDCGITIRAEAAQGEVCGQTLREVTLVTPSQRLIKRDTGREMKKISLLLGKNRINLWKDSGISGHTCDRMYAEYYITLPGGFQLPAGLAVETCQVYEMDAQEYPVDETGVSQYAMHYLTDHMRSGSILRTDAVFENKGDCCVWKGNYVCRELIGIHRQEQIGERNGENSGTDRER